MGLQATPGPPRDHPGTTPGPPRWITENTNLRIWLSASHHLRIFLWAELLLISKLNFTSQCIYGISCKRAAHLQTMQAMFILDHPRLSLTVLDELDHHGPHCVIRDHDGSSWTILDFLQHGWRPSWKPMIVSKNYFLVTRRASTVLPERNTGEGVIGRSVDW